MDVSLTVTELVLTDHSDQVPPPDSLELTDLHFVADIQTIESSPDEPHPPRRTALPPLVSAPNLPGFECLAVWLFICPCPLSVCVLSG